MNRPAKSGGEKCRLGDGAGAQGGRFPQAAGGSPQPHLEMPFVQRRLGFIRQPEKGKALDGPNRRGLVLAHSRAT